MRLRAAAVAGLMATAALTLGSGTAAHAEDPIAPAFEPAWDHGPGGERYVAFGDSFVSGPGILPMRDASTCARSTRNFPSVFAEKLGVTSFTDASCGGAQTPDWFAPQTGEGGVVRNPAQVDALGEDTTLVTLGSMGGNDVGLVQLALDCVFADCVASAAEMSDEIDALADAYGAVIAEVRERAPQATIMAVGYGTYVPDAVCDALPGFTAPELGALQGAIDRMSDTIAAAAESEGVLFADMREIPNAIDHTPCAAPDEQWIRGLNPYDDGSQLHPSSAGMAQMADQVLRTLQQARGTQTALASAAKNVKVTAKCQGPRSRPARRTVVLKARGDRGLADSVTFRIGKVRIATDRSSPWLARTKVAKVASARGKVVAVVTLRKDGAERTRTVTAGRPGCLKR